MSWAGIPSSIRPFSHAHLIPGYSYTSCMACVRAPVRLAGSVMLPITPFCGCSKSMCVDKASLVGYAVGLNTWSTFALLLLPSAMLTPHTYISSTAQGSSVGVSPTLNITGHLQCRRLSAALAPLVHLEQWSHMDQDGCQCGLWAGTQPTTWAFSPLYLPSRAYLDWLGQASAWAL